MDMNWAIVAVMLACGVLGGIVNFFLADPGGERPLVWWKHVVIGIVAAFMVPLFLNMISSGLIDGIRGTSAQPGDSSKLYVLAGFCLVAAVSSRAFIRTLSDRVLQEARSANKKAEEAQEQAAEARAIVAPLVEAETPDRGAANIADEAPAADLPADERAILAAMSNTRFTMRSVSGLSKDTGLEKAKVNQAISSLISKGYVAQAQTSSGQLRWHATSTGRSVAASG